MEHHNTVIVGHSQRELNLWFSSCSAVHLQIECQTQIYAVTCHALLDTLPDTNGLHADPVTVQ
jgi:hypothetical protein